MEAGVILRTARQRHGVTQQQLATRARTSQAAISRIERGVVSPSIATLESLLSLVGEQLQLAAEPIDYGFDRTLHIGRLAMSVEGRIRAQAAHTRGVRRFQDAIGVEPIYL
jgi:transcriptional regulator with XRE-family HTH domain